MDIRDWPLDQILQLPDSYLGRRDMVTVHLDKTGIGTGWAFSPQGFPERMVVWEFWLQIAASDETLVGVKIRLGDALPTTAAEVIALEPLFANFGFLVANDYQLEVVPPVLLRFNRLKKPIQTMGRRLVIQAGHAISANFFLNIGVIFSSIPKEVPDWLISPPVRSQ